MMLICTHKHTYTHTRTRTHTNTYTAVAFMKKEFPPWLGKSSEAVLETLKQRFFLFKFSGRVGLREGAEVDQEGVVEEQCDCVGEFYGRGM